MSAADTWLAVAGSSVPFHFTAGQALPGIETPVAAGPTGGLAAAADGSGNIWELVQDNGQFKLVKSGPDGKRLAATALPGAADGNWDLGFDATGAALAVEGNQNSPDGRTPFVSIYRVAASGGVLLSSAAFAGGAVAFDSSGGLWVTGARTLDAGQTFDLALWKFDPAGTSLLAGPVFRPGCGLGPKDLF